MNDSIVTEPMVTHGKRIGSGPVEHDQAVQTLEISEKRYRRLFEAARDGILILDAITGYVVDVNPFLIELTGFSHEDFLGKHIWDIGPFRDVPAAKELFAALQIEKYLRYEHLPLKTRDGLSIAVEVISNVYGVDNEDVIQCNIRDISARYKAEEELRFSSLILSTQQESSIDGILVVDFNGMIVSSNRRFADMWGIPAVIMNSHSAVRVLRVKIDENVYPEEFISKVKYLYANPDLASQDEIVLKDGRTFDRYSAPMIGADGSNFGRFWSFRDITLGKLTESRARQQQKLESIGTLASGVAHEINNPLNVILNYGELLIDNPADPVRVKDFAQNIVNESERVAVIVRTLLNFSRQDKEGQSPAQLKDIVENTLSLMSSALMNDHITVERDIPDDLPNVRCWSQQIQQVVMNLLTNARDALNQRYPKIHENKTIRIVVAPFEKDGVQWVRLTVEDHGCGIPSAVAGNVFDPFFTTKSRDKGTGLGLSISNGIVQDHHGKLWFETEADKGTMFHVDLPPVGYRSVAEPG